MRIWRTIVIRVTLVALTIAVGGFLSATLVRYAPGFGTDERQLDARLSGESIAAIRATSADERNIVSSYGSAFRRATRGDLGTSRTLQRPVRELIAERGIVTLRTVGAGLMTAWLAALLLVLASWELRSEVPDISCTAMGGLLLCLPAGAVALLMIMLNLPGYIALALVVFPKVHRYLTRLVRTAARLPHILTAKAAGVSSTRVLSRHVGPVISREVLALAGVSVGMAIGAAIPVEALCGIPGIGQLAWQSALARDLPVLIDVSMLVTACTVLANSGAELLEDVRKGL
jgi:peptide/nickel transport system permease protein